MAWWEIFTETAEFAGFKNLLLGIALILGGVWVLKSAPSAFTGFIALVMAAAGAAIAFGYWVVW